MFLYEEVLRKRGLSKLLKKMTNCNNVSDIKKYLDSVGVTQTTKVCVIKELFDSNLQGEYKEIIASGGMCGYWGLLYKKLFDSLGYETELIEICGINKRFHHIICRVKLYKIVIDISRSEVCIGNTETSAYMEYWLRTVKKQYGNSHMNKIEDIETLYDTFTLYSAVDIGKDAYNQLEEYTESVCNGNLSDYNYKDFETLCVDELNYKVLTGYATLEERTELSVRLYKEHKPIRE